MLEQILQKASNILTKSGSILIIPEQLLNNEVLGSSFGLALFLESLEKKTDVLISSDIEEKLALFQSNSLKKPTSLISEIFDPRAFVIKINTKQKPPNQLKYESEEHCLKIIIDSEKENFTKEDVSFEYTPFDYDLIITIGISDLKNLGQIYSENTDFFKNIPTINIHTKPIINSEKYHKNTALNIINQGYVSKSEIVLSLIEEVNKKSISRDVANWLLLAIIEATDNFQKDNLSEATTNTLPSLVGYGAQKENIIKTTESKEDDQIFNAAAKILSQKELVKIKNNLLIKIPKDYFKEEFNKKTLVSLAREVSLNFTKIDNIFLFLEKNKEFIVAAYIKNGDDFSKIINQINGSVYENCIFTKIKASSLDDAQQKIITLLNISW